MSILGVEDGRTRLPRETLGDVETSGVDNVVLFALDGLGWSEWRRQTGSGFFGAMDSKGRAVPITTVFPSTTAAALTTLVTGLTPQEHGLVEWFLYLKEAGMVIQTLPFSPVGARGSDALLSKVNPRVLFHGEPIFARLKREGVHSHSYLSRYISRSAYSRLAHAASSVHGSNSLSDLAVMLRRTLESGRGPSFHYVYWSSIDTLEHVYGPGGEESYLEAAGVSYALKTGLLDRLGRDTASKTLLVVTADHGHVYSPMKDATWLNDHRRVTRSLARGQNGKAVLPWGSPRDVYLRIQDDRLDETYGYLSEELEDTASVVKTADAVASGLFGKGEPSAAFKERVGNIMVLPRGTRSVWYRYPRVEPPSLTGQHGGLHRDEMTVPFAVARASSVI